MKLIQMGTIFSLYEKTIVAVNLYYLHGLIIGINYYGNPFIMVLMLLCQQLDSPSNPLSKIFSLSAFFQTFMLNHIFNKKKLKCIVETLHVERSCIVLYGSNVEYINSASTQCWREALSFTTMSPIIRKRKVTTVSERSSSRSPAIMSRGSCRCSLHMTPPPKPPWPTGPTLRLQPPLQPKTSPA